MNSSRRHGDDPNSDMQGHAAGSSPEDQGEASPIIRLRGPGHLLTAVGYLLGYRPPEGSLVIVGMHQQQVALITRIDLPSPTRFPAAGGPKAAWEAFDPPLAGSDADTVAIIAYTDPSWNAQLQRFADTAPLPVSDVLRVDSGRWWSLNCPDPAGCRQPACAPAGAEITDHIEVTAPMIASGAVTPGTREDLARCLQAGPPDVVDDVAALLETQPALSQHGTAGPFRICRGSSTLRRKVPHTGGRCHIRKEPAVMTSVKDRGAIHLGLDVHKNTISVGVLEPDVQVPVTDKISSDPDAVRRLVARFNDPGRLRACYEAGPTGYELARQLRCLGVSCEVIAPSLIPTAPGDRVKTDKRDCQRLTRLHRAGELVAIRVPTVPEEAVRDLCRARADMVIDQARARHRLGKFLLRHGRVWRGGDNWTVKHRTWINALRFDEPALKATFDRYRATLTAREAAVGSIEADLAQYYTRAPFADPVARLAAYRGITHLGALTLASEVCDWRRFPTAGAFMGLCGLVPSEYSSGQRTRRGHITHAGNLHLGTQLVESAWSYKSHPAVGVAIARRHAGLPPEVTAHAWKAQLRLTGRFRRLDARKTSRNVVVTAIARELAGYVWAEMTAD
jgi:transposase